MGSITLTELLHQADTDEVVGKMKVLSVLESLPGLGKVKARRLMDEVGISETRRLHGLGDQQRKRLFEKLQQLTSLRSRRPGRRPRPSTRRDRDRVRPRRGRQGNGRRPGCWSWSPTSGCRGRGRPGPDGPASRPTPTCSWTGPTFQERDRRRRVRRVDRVSRGNGHLLRHAGLRSAGSSAVDAQDVVLEIELDGAQQIKRRHPRRRPGPDRGARPGGPGSPPAGPGRRRGQRAASPGRGRRRGAPRPRIADYVSSTTTLTGLPARWPV